MSNATLPTAPPASQHDVIRTRELLRERIDRMTMRSFGERRALRTLRQNGTTSAWDSLERAVFGAATALWECASSDLAEDLGAYCAFLARELETNEAEDLAPADDVERLHAFAPRALDALDAIAGPLLTEAAEADPVTREIARAFGKVRAQLMVAVPATSFARAA